MPIPVIISNLGIPVRAVDRGAPEMQVSSNGLGIPIRLSDRGVPFVVLGLAPVGQPPQLTSAPTVAPSSGPVGTVFTITPGSYSSDFPITRVGQLRQNGAVVANRTGAGAFTFTSTAFGPLVWTETVSNEIGSAPVASASAMILKQLQQFYDSGTIGIHLRRDGVTPTGGPATAIANEGGAGAAFNATVVGNPLPVSGNYLQASTTTGYAQTANNADLVGVRLMWVMSTAVANGSYRFFGRAGMTGVTPFYLLRTVNGTGIQLISNATGSNTTVSLSGIMPASTAVRMFELEMTPTQVQVWVNGTLAGTQTHPWGSYLIDRIAQGDNNTQVFEGQLGDVLGVVSGRGDTVQAIAAARYYLDQRFALGIGFPAPIPQPAAQRTIIITDYAGDCDDAAAMAIACQAHRDGIINLLGVVASSNVATAAPGVRGQLNAYGMQSIPVYAYQGSIGSYNNRLSAAVRDIFGVSGQLRDAFQDDVVGLRTLLAAAPNGSVKVIDIGAPVSGARLLDSPADGISPLTGMQLVAAKVSALYQMAGRFDSDTTPEYNAAQDVASTRRVYQDWPTPVFAHGGELGRDIFSGPPAATDVLTDPVKAAFESYKSFDQLVNDKRHSWDPIAVDQGIYGNQSLYQLGGQNGTITVADDGRTIWSATPAGNRAFVSRLASAAAIGSALDARIAPIAIPTPSPRRKITRSYNLTEGTGTTTTPSAGSPLTMVGGATWRTGPVGITLNGISGRLVGPATNDITLADYMVGFVFRPTAINGIRQLYTMNEYEQRIGHFRLSAGVPQIITFNGNTGQTLAAPTALAVNTWAMAVFYVTDTRGTIRVNGAQVADATMGRRNKALWAGLEQAVGAEKNAFTFAFQNFFQGDVIAFEILTGAEASDASAMETRLRSTATAKGVTLP